MRSVISRVAAFLLLVFVTASLVGCQSTYVRSAKIYLQQNDSNNAKKVLLDGAQQTPNDPELWYILGKVYADDGEWDKMNEAFAKTEKLTDKYDGDIKSTRYEAWRKTYNSAVTPFNKKEYDKAIDILQTALRIKPGDHETLKRLGLSYLQNGDYKDAETYLQESLDSDTSGVDVATMYNLLLIYWRQEMYEDAIKQVDQIFKVGSEKIDQKRKIDLIQKKALALQKLGRMDDAIQAWEDAIASDPNNADFYYNKAILLHSMSKFDEAAKAYLKAIELNPKDNEARINAARSLLASQQWETIIHVLEPMLYPDGDVKVYDPEVKNLDAWRILYAAYQNVGDKKKAEVTNQIVAELVKAQGDQGDQGK